MGVTSKVINLSTEGETDIVDITRQVSEAVQESPYQDGIVTVFSPSSTSSLTTIEYESGAISDLRRLFDEIVDLDRYYAHNQRWGDGNGYSHVRAALMGPSITIPFNQGKLDLGTWQQIIFLDFDNKPRRRQIQVQIIGE